MAVHVALQGKTLAKNENPKFSYRNNENYQMQHSGFSNNRLELVYTKYEVKRSIIKEDGCIQPNNPVFSTLTGGEPGVSRTKPRFWQGVGLYEPYNFYNASFRFIFGERRVLVLVNNFYVDDNRIFNISVILVDYSPWLTGE